ncbi:MAG: hypothetical protein KDC95_03590 [Planctomycetes bacterium]|nr:hypothetical protein [Planctomycetota bacterium]
MTEPLKEFYRDRANRPWGWDHVKQLVGDALELEPPARAALVARIRADDAALGAAVRALLESYDGSDGFLESGATLERDIGDPE